MQRKNGKDKPIENHPYWGEAEQRKTKKEYKAWVRREEQIKNRGVYGANWEIPCLNEVPTGGKGLY